MERTMTGGPYDEVVVDLNQGQPTASLTTRGKPWKSAGPRCFLFGTAVALFHEQENWRRAAGARARMDQNYYSQGGYHG